MDKVAIFCKTFNRDVDRFKVLFESIKKHNVDNIPFYAVIPREDSDIFRKNFGTTELRYIFTHDIYKYQLMDSWIVQELCKQMLWRMGLAYTIVTIDSDSYFIKDFRESDFVDSFGTPYLVCHERKEFWSFVRKFVPQYKNWFDIRKKIKGRIDEATRCKTHIPELPDYDFYPPPIVWSHNIWQDLFRVVERDPQIIADIPEPELLHVDLKLPKILESCIKLNDFMLAAPLYGEFCLQQHKKVHIRGPYFKSFDVKEYYDYYKNQEYKEEDFQEDYFGILMNSSWKAPLKY